jgi:REP element-mobilizing transposase RayT
MVQNALLHFHGSRYRLIAWCLMPNHVHTLLEIFTGYPVGKIVLSWKTFTARQINCHLSQSGPLWQDDYFDTFMRDDEHQVLTTNYIESNPVKAGLVKNNADWPRSSASHTRSASVSKTTRHL